MLVVGKLLAAGKKVIDLSADYRIRKTAVYEKWYHTAHKDTKNLSRAVYGLSEIYRAKIRKADLLANPGCYPTAALLALVPIASVFSSKIVSVDIDAKSGVSGAGRKVAEALMFPFVNENFKAYRVLAHQHAPEIAHYLSRVAGRWIVPSFVPHLLPVESGILETVYVHLDAAVNEARLLALYKKFYKTEPFVRVLEAHCQPELRHVVRTNFCDIGIAVGENKKLVVITAAIDNLVKGASGQAVQNLNIMCGFNETEGLL
jgi:N-acetyl-gamma-glutamyl-phosphate reductase